MSMRMVRQPLLANPSEPHPPIASRPKKKACLSIGTGRRYHRYQEGKYMLPNDEVSQFRNVFGVVFSTEWSLSS